MQLHFFLVIFRHEIPVYSVFYYLFACITIYIFFVFMCVLRFSSVYSNDTPSDGSSHKNITKNELLRPLSKFPWIEARPSSARHGSGSAKESSDQKNESASASASVGAGAGAGISISNRSASNSNSSNNKLGSTATNIFKVGISMILY